MLQPDTTGDAEALKALADGRLHDHPLEFIPPPMVWNGAVAPSKMAHSDVRRIWTKAQTMGATKNTASNLGTSSSFVPLGDLPEDEQIALLIKLFDLDPVLKTAKVIAVTGDTRTDFYARQDPKEALFDPTYPEPIGGRRSGRSPRSYWTVDILRWRIRRASTGSR